jgi:hypothetical protein
VQRSDGVRFQGTQLSFDFIRVDDQTRHVDSLLGYFGVQIRSGSTCNAMPETKPNAARPVPASGVAVELFTATGPCVISNFDHRVTGASISRS